MHYCFIGAFETFYIFIVMTTEAFQLKLANLKNSGKITKSMVFTECQYVVRACSTVCKISAVGTKCIICDACLV